MTKRNTLKLALAGAAVTSLGLGSAAIAQAQPLTQKPTVESYSMVVQSRGRLGAKVITMSDDLRSFFGAPKGRGLLIDEVLADSPAAKAGLRSGDVIISANGQAISEHWDIMNAMSGTKKGDSVSLEIVRGKKKQTLSAVLDTDDSPIQLHKGAAGKFDFDFEGFPFGGESLAPDFGRAFSFDESAFGPSSIFEKMRRMEQRLNKLEGKSGDKKRSKSGGAEASESKNSDAKSKRPFQTGGRKGASS